MKAADVTAGRRCRGVRARDRRPAGIAGQLVELAEYGLPLDHFDHYVAGVLRGRRADVERVTGHYIDPENIAIFNVGDRTVIERQVLDLRLGEVRFLDVADVLGPLPSLQ
jgi:predicted Zn-dependent peptidase